MAGVALDLAGVDFAGAGFEGVDFAAPSAGFDWALTGAGAGFFCAVDPEAADLA